MYKLFNSVFVIFCFLIISCSSEKTPKESQEAENSTKNSIDKVSEHKSETSEEVKDNRPIILFLGNSLTAGYGVEKSQAFPALIQAKIDSLSLHYQVINAGVSGETTAGGREKVNWYLKQKPTIFILELGGNDALRGIKPTETRENLSAIIEIVQSQFPKCKILLAGMEAPPNMGDNYTFEFRKIYPELAEKYQTARIPFLLDIVGGNPELNQADGIHPTAEGHEIVAETVWKYLEDLL